MSNWRVGMGSAVFSVPPGTAMGGYADRTGPSVGTSDTYPLTVTALNLGTGTDSFTIIGADVIGVDTQLRAEVVAQAGIPAESLLIGATHTHSGPEGVLERLHPAGSATRDPEVRGHLVDLVAGVVRASRLDSVAVELTMHEAICPGLWSNRNEPEGPTDPRVRVLRVASSSNDVRALVVVIPTHPTILDATNREIASDLPGGVRRALNDTPGWEGVQVLMLTGRPGTAARGGHGGHLPLTKWSGPDGRSQMAS